MPFFADADALTMDYTRENAVQKDINYLCAPKLTEKLLPLSAFEIRAGLSQ